MFPGLAAMMVAAAPVLAAEELTAPSGLTVSLFDLRLEPEAALARFRFLAPQIADTAFGFDAIGSDFAWLCTTYALPELDANGWSVETVIISLSDRILELGQIDPEAVQYFEGFRVTDGTCQWEPF